MSKSGFTLLKPTAPALKKDGYTLSICAAAGGGDITVTVADIEEHLAEQGLAVEVIRIYATTAAKGRLTIDSITGTDIVASGFPNIYTDEGGDPQYVHPNERAGKEVCLLDENCDMIPDESVDDGVNWVISEGSCMVFEFDVTDTVEPKIFNVNDNTSINTTFVGIHNPNDLDLDGAIVNYTFTSQPPASEGVFTFTNPATGEFEFVPAAGFLGTACANVEGTDNDGNTATAIYCITIEPAPVVRLSTLNDSDLRNVEITPAGSTDCEGNVITDFTNYNVKHPLYLADGTQTMTDVSNLSPTDNVRAIGTDSGVVTTGGLLLVDVYANSGLLSFDWTNSGFTLNAADMALVEAEISLISAATAGIAFDKYQLDTVLKGSSYSDNCDYSNTNTTGVNYLSQDLGLAQTFDVDGTPHMEGAFLVLKEATLEDVSAICAGAVSLPETTEYIAKKGIKRVKHSFTNYSTSALSQQVNNITASINRSNARTAFNSQCFIPSYYASNEGQPAPNNDASSDVGGADWWRLKTSATTADLQLGQAPWNVVYGNYSGDNPLMPTDSIGPLADGVYYASLDSERVNGLNSDVSAYYETPRVNSDAGGINKANPFAHIVLTGMTTQLNYQRFATGFLFRTGDGNTFVNEFDSYQMNILDYDYKIVNQLGTRMSNWTSAGAGLNIFTNTAGDLKAAQGAAFIPPQFMNISERWSLEGNMDIDYNGLLPNPVITHVEMQIVETF